ncbi:hypothetical protein EPO15_18140 [bacterium]|nr:MAG: hypothetical protein EPO15_18140 [bacterium]
MTRNARFLLGALALSLPRPAAAELAPDARAKFDAQWERRGRLAAAKTPWTRSQTILLLAAPEVDPALPPVVEKALRAQLAELGARKLKVERGEPPEEFGKCVKGGVLEQKCFTRALAVLRMTDARLRGSAVYYLTNAALGRLPKDLGGGVSLGPQAGTASSAEGWLTQSFFYRLRNLEKDPTLAAFGGPAFSEHSVDHTARHELGHLLGLGHHETIENPGFPEAVRCDRCKHALGGPHAPPHDECLMFCGSSDDDWFHRETFKSGFGLCPKCAAAATAYLKGLEGR